MKKRIFVLLFIFFIVSALSAEDVLWGSMYDSGNFRLGVGAAFESSGAAVQLSAYPEAEILLWKPEFGNLAFIDVGAAIDGRIGIPLQSSAFSVGAGLFGTLHIGFRGFDFPGSEYLWNTDYYAKAGLKLDFITTGTAFGAAFQTGVNYFFSDSFSAGLYYSYWGTYSGGGVAVSLKLGNTPEVKGMKTALVESGKTGFTFDPYLMQFYTLYYASHFAGGFYPESYEPGEESVYEISTIDSSGTISYTVRKSLLKRLDGDMSLWGLEYRDDEDSFYFEYTADDEGKVGKVYYKSDDELVVMDADAAVNPDAEYLRWEDYNAEKKSGVNITIKAGRFDADEYSYTDTSGVMINWWVSEKVPGKLLSYKMEDGSDIVISELIEVNKGRKPVLYK